MNKINKILVFDMDGTIADFYGVENWQHYLDDLQDETPYRIAKPMYDMCELNLILMKLKSQGWYIVVNSWLSRVSTDPTFHSRIEKAKREWLNNYDFPADFLIFTPYGVDKHAPFKDHNGRHILIDDNDEIRNAWHGETINANKNILPALRALLSEDNDRANYAIKYITD